MVLFSAVGRIEFVDKQLAPATSVLGPVVSRLFDTMVSKSSLDTGYSAARKEANL